MRSHFWLLPGLASTGLILFGSAAIAQNASEDAFIEQMLQRPTATTARRSVFETFSYRAATWLRPQFAQANPTIQGDPNQWLLADGLPAGRAYIPEDCNCELIPAEDKLDVSVETAQSGGTSAPPTPPPPPMTPTMEPLPMPPVVAPTPAPIAAAPPVPADPVVAQEPAPFDGQPQLRVDGIYLQEGDEGSPRVRVSGVYPINRQALIGGAVDFATGDIFQTDINELYLAIAPLADQPNLRFIIGQNDVTSYFDRNSFAKDNGTHFFSPVFQTNPALAAAGIGGSRQSAIMNWTIADNLDMRVMVFSSAPYIGDFELNGTAAEVAYRTGNAIVRGTYVASIDAGTQTTFPEAFSLIRSDGENGVAYNDREEAYGINAEWFFPDYNIGLFGRYGFYRNRTLDLGASNWAIGLNIFDLLMEDSRFGLAYGYGLSNQQAREALGLPRPDVLETFYDFRALGNLRIGLSLQSRNEFSETEFGFRVKTGFDLTNMLGGS